MLMEGNKCKAGGKHSKRDGKVIIYYSNVINYHSFFNKLITPFDVILFFSEFNKNLPKYNLNRFG